MYEKCPQCQQKAMEDAGYCGACGYCEEFEHPPLNPFDPLNEHGIKGSEAGEFLRKFCQAAYCLDYDVMCEVIYGEHPKDMTSHRREYTKKKWDVLNEGDLIGWFCQLDSSNAQLFADYVLRKGD